MSVKRERKSEEAFLPTRISLLARLRNREDQDSWRDFFETYWRVIYCFATGAGLSDQEAQDVVQETVISVAGTMPKYEYDPSVCSFKGWLRHLTNKRIVDQFRKRPREVPMLDAAPEANSDVNLLDRLTTPHQPELDEIWQKEWEDNLRAVALERLQRNVKAKHFQIFTLHVLQAKPANEVCELLGVSGVTVYVVKHRLSRLLREIGKKLEQNPS